MEQRVKKAKLFRTLKVVYYCLGFPIFLFVTFALVSQNLGHEPFMGEGAGVMSELKGFLVSPAMYAFWIALAIWLVIGIVQIICNFAIKNRRNRAMVVVAVMLVVLLLPVFAIDAIYTAKVDELMVSAPVGTVVRDYKTQLSNYRMQTSGRESLTETLKNNVYKFQTSYNIATGGGLFGGSAMNFTNEALYYDMYGLDYNADGTVDELDHVLIRDLPDPYAGKSDAELTEMGAAGGEYNSIPVKDHLGDTINDKDGNPVEELEGKFILSHHSQPVSDNNKENVHVFLWYDGTKYATLSNPEGGYGEAYYNQNGTFADGYVYSTEVALNILESYYQAQIDMKSHFAAAQTAGYTGTEADLRADIEAEAATRQKNYYLNSEDETLKTIWEREEAYAAGYSLTTDELNAVLNELGGALGTAQLIGDLLPIIDLALGGLEFSVEQILGLVLGDMPETMNFLKAQLADLVNIKLAIKWSGNLQIVLKDLPGGRAEETIDVDSSFSVASVKELLDTLGISNGMLAEIIGLLGLEASAPEANTVSGLEEMLGSLLGSLYWHQSPVILPEYEFYEDEARAEDDAVRLYQAAYAKLRKAEYMGGTHGYMAGSRLIGSSIGNGTDAANGLQNLAAVQQLKLDLSYQPVMYSILIIRDMLMTFSAFILFFTMMSYIAADREVLWATGQIKPKQKKAKKGETDDKAAENNEEVA